MKKKKLCKFFIAQNGSPAVLGMQDIDKLGLISVNYNTTHRQVAEDDNINNSESPHQTEGSKCEQFKGEKEKEEAQNTQDADNTPEPPIVSNPMVMGINNNNNELITDLIADTRNNGSIDFLAGLLGNQSLVSDAERKDDTMTKHTQINCDGINFISEPLINHGFVSVKERKDDTTTENAKINTNEKESFILDILKDIGIEAPTTQKKKKRKQNKKKK